MNRFDISGKIILVTGGTRGLGGAISMHMASQGAIVFAGYFQNEAAAETFRGKSREKGHPSIALRANLMTGTGIQALVDQVISAHGRLDALIYSSATGVHKPLESLTQRHLSAVWQVNVGAFFDLCLKFKPHMSVGSRIVAVSSEGAAHAMDQYGAIGTSKAALEALCRQMAAEWAADGIGVNLVSPGLLETETLAAMEHAEERVKHEKLASPLRRLVKLEEVASVV
ncbi:MAG: SDR family oxidoreductase, partial [Fibrobacterota bacterium]|nr:SDR family oxidoreductase [Fibrobacterota bacterium]